MLNLSCVVCVASFVVLLVTLAVLLFPSRRMIARRTAIASAVLCLCAAGAFDRYSEAEARAHGFSSFSEMMAAQKPTAKPAVS